MQLILSIYHVICSVTSKINIKNSAKFNIRSTSRLTYDIISQLHLPQNGYFMERSNFLVAIIMLILRSLAIIPADSSAYAMRLLHSFLSWRYGGTQEMIFSSTFVGKYSFGHYDLNLPDSQLFAGWYGNKRIETSSWKYRCVLNINKPARNNSGSSQLRATKQETYFMMRIMPSLMADRHLSLPCPLSYLANRLLFELKINNI